MNELKHCDCKHLIYAMTTARTLVGVVLDDAKGSVKHGYKEFIRLHKSNPATGGESRLTLVRCTPRVVYMNENVTDIESEGGNEPECALCDAISETVAILDKCKGPGDYEILAIVTDGRDTCSRKHSLHDTKELVYQRELIRSH